MVSNDHPATEIEPTSELTLDFSRTAHALFSAGSVEATLQQVVDLAVATIDGCDFAGIFVLDGETVTTPVRTDPMVTEIDTAQHRTGEGPCLDAIVRGGTFYADDLAGDPRWPRFGPVATAAGIRSALALCLSTTDSRGALNLYAQYPQAFGVVDRAKGLILAALADIALSSAVAHDDEQRRADNLQAAMVTREMIGQAQGILMERERITPDQAFDVLRRASQHLNIKLREVAQALVDTGEQPETESSAPPS
jgi:hypothetical protein